MSSFLILGATGIVGSHLGATLAAQGHRVFGATRSPDQASLPQGVEPIGLDLFDPQTFGPALRGVEGVFALSPAGYADAWGAVSPFLQAAIKAPSVRRIVLMTAQGVEYDDTIPLRRLELLLQDSGKEVAFLRPSWFMQNFESYWSQGLKANDALRLPAAEAKVTFVDTRDIAESAAALLTQADDSLLGKGWTITGPEGLDHHQAAGLIAKATGRPITYTPIEDGEAMEMFLSWGMPEDYAGLLVALFGMVRQGAAAHPTEAVERLTGRPARSLKDYTLERAEAL